MFALESEPEGAAQISPENHEASEGREFITNLKEATTFNLVHLNVHNVGLILSSLLIPSLNIKSAIGVHKDLVVTEPTSLWQFSDQELERLTVDFRSTHEVDVTLDKKVNIVYLFASLLNKRTSWVEGAIKRSKNLVHKSCGGHIFVLEVFKKEHGFLVKTA